MNDRSYYIWTIGCQMNEADSRRLSSELEHIGYQRTESAEDADVVVLNTCVVRQQAENKIYGRLGSLKSVKADRPTQTLALMGCMVGVKEAPRLKERFPYVDVFLPPSDSGPLLDYLEANELYDASRLLDAEDRQLRDALQDAELLLPADQRASAVTAHVPIVLGCSHACTFCIIPYRRGVERSRPVDDVLEEVRSLVDQGIREVTLLGQIVDRYGLELPEPTTLAALLRQVHEIPGLARIRFLTSHPNWMTDELLDTVAELDRVCPHLEVPVQAGNDEVLAAMRRGYTVADYRTLIDRIRDRIPKAAINTDIIVGFPGESESQFMETLHLVEELRFDKVHLARYSPRPKTVASRRMNDDVPESEKARRWHAVDAVQKAILEEKHRARLGATVEVLVERRQNDRWVGRTPDNCLVFFDDAAPALGKLRQISITHAGPYSLRGEPAVTPAARSA
jgi:tRNA-2-methylthio-N6-dimethylallyladenosine synthase